MGKGNLLIVDDEPFIIKGLRSNLEDYADEIFTANNGVEALEILGKELIHCVICDINMPKMNGVEVIKKIRANGNEVPFIFYTAHGNNDLMIEAAKYGAYDFLNKPNLDGLEDVISRGLKCGFDRQNKLEKSEDAYLSEYQSLLDDIEEK